MKNLIKQRISNGQQVVGTLYELGGNAVAQCLGISGLDFFMIDTEHGPYDVENAMHAISATAKYPITPLVRVKDGSRASLLKMLDIGAQGVIVPCVETVDEVKSLVQYAKYYPMGNRGFAPTISSQYGYADYAQSIDRQFATCNSEALLLPQCETIGCLNNIEEIVSVEGVDGIFIGPYDLSVALDIPAQMDEPILKNAIRHVLEVTKKHGKISLIYANNPQTAKIYLAEGFDCVACGMDSILLIEACKSMVEQIYK